MDVWICARLRSTQGLPVLGTDHKAINWCGGDRCRSRKGRPTVSTATSSCILRECCISYSGQHARLQGGSIHLDATQADWSLAWTGGADPVESLVRHAARGSRRSHASTSRLKNPLLLTTGVKPSDHWLAVTRRCGCCLPGLVARLAVCRLTGESRPYGLSIVRSGTVDSWTPYRSNLDTPCLSTTCQAGLLSPPPIV